MNPFVVEGILGMDTPAMVDVKLIANSVYDYEASNRRNYPTDDYWLKGYIDTASRQCLIPPGTLNDTNFGSQPLVEIIENVEGVAQRCRGQLMFLEFSTEGRTKRIEVPVFEMRMGLPNGVMIIGRTLQNQAVLTYDGPNRKVTLTFAHDSPLTAEGV